MLAVNVGKLINQTFYSAVFFGVSSDKASKTNERDNGDLMSELQIHIIDSYHSNSSNIEYQVFERENGTLYEMDSGLNLYKLTQKYPDALLWFKQYESMEAHDNGEELVRLYASSCFSKSTRERIYQLEKYFIYEDIE